jgi:outer membrane protein
MFTRTKLLSTVCTFALLLHSSIVMAQPADKESAKQSKSSAAENASKETASVVTRDENFRDALIATYLENPRIIAQRKAYDEAGEKFNQAISGWLPNISANYDKGRRRNSAPNRDWTYENASERRLDVVQPLFSGGETYYSTSQANNIIGASGAQLISTTQDVMTGAISAYLDVVRDRTILDLSLNNIEVLKKHLTSSNDRFNAGEATKTDVSQSEARLSRAQSDAIQAEGQLITSEAAYARIVGSRPLKTLTYPKDLPPIPTTQEDVTKIALKQNPRIIAARFTEDAADDGVGINIARILPEVSLRGSMNRTKGASVSGVDYDTDALLVDVNIPLYQGGAEYSRVREAKITKSRRRYELLDTTNEIRQQSIEAWERYQTSVAAIQAQRDTITAAEVALDGVKQEQLYGTRTLLDVLDAQQELFSAEVALERTERSKLAAIYNLLSITGQLSPANLKLGISDYDNEAAIDDIKYQFIGF